MVVDIVGSGRLGRTLALLLQRAGWKPTLRDRSSAAAADLVVLAVPDRAIAEVARGLTGERVVLHTSGALDLAPLASCAHPGSFHPLMSFPGPDIAIPDLRGVPAAIDGDPPALAFARELAAALEMEPFRVPGDRRLYHAAAVLAGNAVTLMLEQGRRALVAAGVPSEGATRLLLPLALRSLTQAGEDPLRALTGPLVRGDEAVLDGHDAALRESGMVDTAELHRAIRTLARIQLQQAGLYQGSSDTTIKT